MLRDFKVVDYLPRPSNSEAIQFPRGINTLDSPQENKYT
jgi:hypothetical protein